MHLNLDVSEHVSHPELDVLYDPFLDDSKCVSVSSKSECFVSS